MSSRSNHNSLVANIHSLGDIEPILGEPGHTVFLADGERRVELPEPLSEVLREALAALKAGHDVSVVPCDRELTTQQAADILNVSRPFLIRLLDRGDIDFRRNGTHRRLLLRDVLSYRVARTERRLIGLGELAREAEALGMVLE